MAFLPFNGCAGGRANRRAREYRCTTRLIMMLLHTTTARDTDYGITWTRTRSPIEEFGGLAVHYEAASDTLHIVAAGMSVGSRRLTVSSCKAAQASWLPITI